MDRTPALPSPLERRCGQLSPEHQIWIPHGDASLIATARSHRTAGPRASLAAPVSCRALTRRRCAIERTAGHDAATPAACDRRRHGDQYGLAATSSRGDYPKSLCDSNEIPAVAGAKTITWLPARARRQSRGRAAETREVTPGGRAGHSMTAETTIQGHRGQVITAPASRLNQALPSLCAWGRCCRHDSRLPSNSITYSLPPGPRQMMFEATLLSSLPDRPDRPRLGRQVPSRAPTLCA